MTSSPSAWPSHWGLRCAWALALIEIGIAGRSGFLSLQDPVLMALFILAPFGVYGLVGLLLDLSLGRLASRAHWMKLIPLLLFLGFAIFSIRGSMQSLRGTEAMVTLALAGGGAALLLWRGFSQAPQGSRFLPRFAWLIAIVGCGGVYLFLTHSREVESRAPIASREDGPNVVLITWDTVRADVLPIYGGRGLEMPVLDALATRSTVFEDMCAVAPITSPSHASIITGVVPPTHAIRSNGPFDLTPDVATLAELFSDDGYATGAFVAAYPVRGEVGFDRGFDIFDDRFPWERSGLLTSIGARAFTWLRPLAIVRKRNATSSVDGDVILERAGDFLERAEGPYFMWTHFFDAHFPYTPEAEILGKAVSLQNDVWPLPVNAEKCKDLMTEYRAEIMELDTMLGHLIAKLEVKDPGLQNTVIFLVADHGQCFGEGGFINAHKPSLMEATQHIPGVLYVPGAITRRSAFPVNQIDVVPTLLAAAEINIPKEVQGVDLTPLARGEKDQITRGIFADGFYMEAFQYYLKGGESQDVIGRKASDRRDQSTSREDRRKQAIRGRGWKYLKVLSGTEMLFDISTLDVNGQPDALDLREIEAVVFADTKKRFQQMWDAIPKAEENVRVSSARDQNVLRELGYVGDEDED